MWWEEQAQSEKKKTTKAHWGFNVCGRLLSRHYHFGDLGIDEVK